MTDSPLLAINFDEISDNLSVAIELMAEVGVTFGELRTVKAKNFVFWDKDEIQQFKEVIHANNITLVAASTPLFKWYSSPDDAEIPHDSFGFDPRLADNQKKLIIRQTIAIAHDLMIPRLRIFSELGSKQHAGTAFATHPLLLYTLAEASHYGIDILLENEPICTIHGKQDVVEFLQANQHPRLKLWLDIANLIETGEDVSDDFLQKVSSRIGYIHVKNYIEVSGKHEYVPAGEGVIDYAQILPRILRSCPENVVLSVETHAKTGKIEASRKSLRYLQDVLGNDKRSK